MIQLGTNSVTLGNLVGSSGTPDLLRQINGDLGNSNFFNSIDDMLSKGRQMFVTNIVEPIRKVGNVIKNALGSFEHNDRIIPIVTEDQLASIPIPMHMPVLQYAPVRKLFDEGRIFGFGYAAVPEGDPYGRLINNGTIPDVAEAMDKNGAIWYDYHFKSTDPDLSFTELDSIEDTRKYIDQVLENETWDPTDYPNSKG